MYDLSAFIQEHERFAAFRESLCSGQPVTRLRDAKIKITARCNLRCAFCPFWRKPETDELTAEELLHVIDDLGALDCRKIHFSGGEPLLRQDLPTLITRAVALGMKTALTSNGTLMTEEIAHALLAARLHSITISLDSATPDLHDMLRGVKGTFKRTLRGLKHLKRAKKTLKAKTRIRLNMVLTRHNYFHYPEVLALAAELGITEVNPLPVDEGGRSKNRLLPAQLLEYNESIAPAVAALRAEYGFGTAPHLIYPFGTYQQELRQSANVEYARGYYCEHLCYAPWLTTMLTWNGDVWPCCMARGKMMPLGNVRQTSFREIYTGAGYRTFRQAMHHERMPLCHRCDNYLAENQYLASSLSNTECACAQQADDVEVTVLDAGC